MEGLNPLIGLAALQINQEKEMLEAALNMVSGPRRHRFKNAGRVDARPRTGARSRGVAATHASIASIAILAGLHRLRGRQQVQGPRPRGPADLLHRGGVGLLRSSML